MTITILLVRHGQTEWNRIERFRGRFDVELNSTGIEQARKTAQRIVEHWKPAGIYSSPLKRAIQTAEKIAHVCNLNAEPNKGLIDIDYGEWQGLTPTEAREKWAEQITNWYEHPENSVIPGGESLLEVQNRAVTFMTTVAKQHADQSIVIVSHTVVNRLILLYVLGLGFERFWHLQQDPCSINIIEMEDQDFTICSLNDTCHLEG
ncbi:MAG TPA: histidine phosphatase family protein [Bellilinea sp.]|nr:histidine phosphatase family protein [Bellilinea sp.]